MKKILVAVIAAIAMGFSGCTPDESVLVPAAESAGSIGLLTWFTIDNPDPQVKTILKEVITKINTVSVKVSEGETYLNSVLPQIQEFVAKYEKITDTQKQLINAGAVVVLNGLDTFIATNPKVKTNAELVNKIAAAFCKGCLVILNKPEDSEDCKRAREVYQLRNMKCRDGKFVVE